MNRRNALRKTALMAGTAMTAPSLFSLLQSCKQQDRLGWEPLFFSDDQARFVSAFVDTILPRTDTPGGLDVKTDIFLDLIIAKTYDSKAQEIMASEIDKFNADTKTGFGKVFADLSEEGKKSVLRKAEAETAKFNPRVWGTAVGVQKPVGFYRSLKSMVLWGYFTSEEIGKNHLSYDPIPGEFRGCIPLSEVGNAWSL